MPGRNSASMGCRLRRRETALTAGLRYARGQAVIPIDADLQDPPELITDLISKWREGYEVVYAVRSKRHCEPLGKRVSASLFYRLINLCSETPIPRDTGDFRLLDQRVVAVLNQFPGRTRFMKGLFARVGFKQIGISYERDPRHLGKTKWSFWGKRAKGPGRRPHPANPRGAGAAGALDNTNYLFLFIRPMAAS